MSVRASAGFRALAARAVAVPLALVALLGTLLVLRVGSVIQVFEDVDQTSARRVAVGRLYRYFLDYETGLRGYLLTGAPAFLEPYEKARALIGPDLDALAASAPSERAPTDAARLARVRAGHAVLVRHADQMIARRAAGGHDAPEANAEGKRIMDAIRADLDAMIADYDRALDERTEAAARAARATLWTAGGVTLALFLAVAFSSRRRLAAVGATFEGAISAERERTAELAESEERFRRVVEKVRDYAIFLLDPEGRITTWNEGAQRIKGYRADEVLGKSFELLFSEEDRAAGAPARELEKAIAEGHATAHGWRRRKDGSLFWADVTITALRDPSGALRGFAKITRDMTEIRQKQEEITTLNRTLEERVIARTRELEDAYRELETFSYAVSHDLRAPLRGMHGLARLLLEDYAAALDDPGREYAQRIVTSAVQMDTLIQDMLRYGRLSRAEIVLAPTSLARVVDHALTELADEIRDRGAAITVDPPLPDVQAHPVTLTQVLLNLFGNALKFVAPGACPTVHIHAEERGDRVRLWIEDEGIGIAEEHRERIFRPFERLHGIEAYPGTGVGLAIVQRGMERMDGAAGVAAPRAPREGGSRFWIELRKAQV